MLFCKAILIIQVEKIRSGKCEDPEEPAKGVKVDPKDDEKSVVIEERAAEEDEKSKGIYGMSYNHNKSRDFH